MANKKINQLVSKTSILSTDLFGIGDATTGQLFKKTIAELQAAIGGAVISVNGLVGTVVLDTDDIQELATPTNKYFTDARARAAISLTVTGNSGASTYSSGTGVLNVPTYTLAGLGGITASFLSGTSGISYNSGTGVISYSGTVYTDASIRALLSGGTGISYNSSTGAISYSGTVYTDSSVRALISLTTTGNSGASTYNNTTGVINVPEYTLAGLGGISLTSLSGGTGITYNNTTGAISYSGTVYTDASVRALISASGAVSYNNTTGVISLTSGNLTEATSSVLTITGGTGAVLGSGTSIQVKQATTSVSGFLSSTDWTTFNNKANALSGTTNYVAKFTSSTAIGNSLIYDDGTNIGVGTTTPNQLLSLRKTSAGAETIALALQNIGSTAGTAVSMIFSPHETSATPEPLAKISAIRTATSGALTDLAFYTYGSGGLNERMRIFSLGNLLLNTSTNYNVGNDSNKGIVINSGGAGYASFISLRTSNADRGIMYANDSEMLIGSQTTIPLLFYTNNVEAIRVTSAQNVGIGTSAPTSKLDVRAGTSIGLTLDQTNDNGADWLRFSYTNRTGNYGSFRMMGNGVNYIIGPDVSLFAITGGNILMGTTTNNGERLYVSGDIRATGSITANSDISLKKNLLKIENALEKVEQINGYTYELKEDDSKRHAGVIAQEIQEVLPEIVNKGNNGLLGVEYGNISALLIEAIKEQNIKIKNLETLLASK